MRSRFGKAGRLVSLAVLALVLSGLFVACGGGGGDTTQAGGDTTQANGGGGEDAGAAAEERLAGLYEGTFAEPSGPPVEGNAGDNVWVVSIGQELPGASVQAKAVQSAGKKLGWDVTIFDGQFNPTVILSGVEQAIANGADGIVLVYVDCSFAKPALQKAAKRGIAVVATEASDCSDVEAGAPELFDWVVHYSGGQPFREWIQDWGEAQSTWVVAETGGESNTIVIVETDTETTVLGGKGATDGLDKCPDCEYTEVEVIGSDLGPRLQEKLEQALLENPDADSVIFGYDGLVTAGGSAALRASGKQDQLAVMGGEGTIPGIELIHDEVVDACVGIPPEWEGYAAVDAVVRLLADKDPAESDSGIGLQVCDREHNLPPSGESFQSPYDFKAAYEGIWGVG